MSKFLVKKSISCFIFYYLSRCVDGDDYWYFYGSHILALMEDCTSTWIELLYFYTSFVSGLKYLFICMERLVPDFFFMILWGFFLIFWDTRYFASTVRSFLPNEFLDCYILYYIKQQQGNSPDSSLPNNSREILPYVDISPGWRREWEIQKNPRRGQTSRG